VTPASGVPARCTMGRSDRVETPGNDVSAESTKKLEKLDELLLPARSELKSSKKLRLGSFVLSVPELSGALGGCRNLGNSTLQLLLVPVDL
jgi:hypothetical protein